MPPPKLPRHAPVLDVLEPHPINLLEPLRYDFCLTTLHGGQRRPGKTLHLDEPLLAHQRLDNLPATLRPRDSLRVWLILNAQTARHQILPELFPRHEPVQTLVLSGVPIQRPVVVHDVDELQVVPLPELVIVNIVPRRDLQCTGSKLHIHVRVGNDRNRPPARHGHHRPPPEQVPESRILRVHRQRRIAKNRLRPCRGNRNRLVRPLDRVLEVVQRALLLRVLHLQVAHGRLQLAIPVHQVRPLIHQPFLVQFDKRLRHGVAQPVVQGEALLAPVTGRPQTPELLRDVAPVLLLPLPNLLFKRCATQVVLRDALLGEHPLHHHLGRNPRVVRARHPERRLAPHTLVAGHDVL
mmetsp:Transcript_3095/g.9184  ORF Transcript_3095/g.9184 Transcript_3095/m.9184 type:complete len:352 (+) Transcript_3095:1410-2465(+)